MCDREFYELQPPSNKADELRDMAQSVEKIIVGSNSKVGSSTLFGGSATNINPYDISNLWLVYTALCKLWEIICFI